MSFHFDTNCLGGMPLPTYTATGALIADDTTLYAEYIATGSEHVAFELVAIVTETGDEFFCEEIVFRPFESVTAAFVGENQTAGNEKVSPGVNDWVKQELLNGYDVHVWDDGYDVFSMTVDCDTFGEGRALDTIANAINNHGQSEVAILGYSHGGGSVYNLSQALAYDGMAFRYVVRYDDYGNPLYNAKLYEDKIHKGYTVVYTSYIDAINNYASLVLQRNELALR